MRSGRASSAWQARRASRTRAIGWTRIGDHEHGLEHLLLDEGSADGLVIAVDEDRQPFRLAYRLTWDAAWRVRDARLTVTTERATRTLQLESDGKGRWRDGEARGRPQLDGCIDIDIWPTPFTNTLPLRRDPMAVGERRVFVMAWVAAPELTVRPARQAYTRLADRRYRFEGLDSDFSAEIVVDADDLVVDYEALFRRVS